MLQKYRQLKLTGKKIMQSPNSSFFKVKKGNAKKVGIKEQRSIRNG